MPNDKSQPWYKDGLKFKCSGCGDCCTGSPGYVWVNKDDIANLAACTGMEPSDFEAQYVRNVGKRKSLKEKEEANFDCVFLDSNRKCTVYEARPRQCRTWPFWESNVRSPEAWEFTCQVCPGSGTGRLYQLGEIEAQKAVIRI